ncbi:MAG: cellulose binding domain-containing protein [Acidobacteriota bacterium]
MFHNSQAHTTTLRLAAIALILFSSLFNANTNAEETRLEAAAMDVLPASINFTTQDFFDTLSLTVGGPDGAVTRQKLDVAGSLSFGLQDDEGNPRPDGLYSYELWGMMKADEPSVLLRSGHFSIAEGSFVDPDLVEGGFDKDQIIADDLIVQASACIGLDCVDGENFSLDALRLKENNLRIHFQDTSSSAAFPTADWRIVINETDNGGADLFSIEQSTSGNTPFTILGTAPTNAMYVDGEGRLGLGTTAPGVSLHAVSGNTPGLRLEQDGSNGFQAQTFELAGNEANFYIKDFSNDEALVFRIKPGAPQNSIYIAADGNIGLGTDSPDARLDVQGDIVVTGTVDGRDIATDGGILDAHLGDFTNPHRVTAEQVGAISEVALEAHVTDFTNPHQVTAEQVGAISQATLDAHTGDFNNPHQVTAEQVGAISQAALDAHVTDFNNPHQVTALQTGAASQSALDGHVADFNNPHQVTAEQVGAVSQAVLDAHVTDFNNPHQVTAAQVGADAAGTAAAAVAALEVSLSANIPSALPVPLSEGGTGGTDAASARAALGIEDDPTQVGIVGAGSFSGSPQTARVSFDTAYSAGTSYIVQLTAISVDPQQQLIANATSKDEAGFTVVLHGDLDKLLAIDWLVRPAPSVPLLAITSPSAGSSFAPGESFQLDYALLSADGVRVTLDGATFDQSGSGPVSLVAPAADGSYEVRLDAIDAAGNPLGASDTVSIEVASPAGVSCVIGNADVFGNGYVLNNITVTNEGSETIDTWAVALQFAEPTSISNSWNADLTLSADGTTLDAVNRSYNGTLAPGQSTTFGFQGTHDGSFDIPTCSGSN